jgi:hypothetical protein
MIEISSQFMDLDKQNTLLRQLKPTARIYAPKDGSNLEVHCPARHCYGSK